MARSSISARSVLWKIHRWIGVGLFVLLVPVALSGALLVYDDEFDALVHPARYATTGSKLMQPTAYLASAKAALGDGQALNIQYPREEGSPVIVQARTGGGEGRPPQRLNVYIDPPTGRMLEVVDFRSSMFGFLHFFHENLTVPEYSGRAIVGWTGVGMLVLALSGIVLWWPRNGAFIPGLRWQRQPATSANLHHMAGFWISLPLAFVSFTGIYLAFPPQARSVMSSIVPMTPQGSRGFGAPLRQTTSTADVALDAALKFVPGARVSALFLPTGARGDAAAPPNWRVQLRNTNDEAVTLLVDDRSGETSRPPEGLSGDRAAQWMRWLHEGSRGGSVWKAIVFLTGVLPAVFGVTGLMMWLRGRRNRKALSKRATGATGALQAAE
jgi:uncharacterized iron-regulated membrane protein